MTCIRGHSELHRVSSIWIGCYQLRVLLSKVIKALFELHHLLATLTIYTHNQHSQSTLANNTCNHYSNQYLNEHSYQHSQAKSAIMSKFFIPIAIAATMVSANPDPSCIVAGSRSSPSYQHALSIVDEASGNQYAFCYDSSDVTISDPSWAVDIRAMLTTMVQSDVCCVDCENAAANGCTGTPGLSDGDSCKFFESGSGQGAGFTQADIDIWMPLVEELTNANTGIDKNNAPALLIDVPNGTSKSGVSFPSNDQC